MSLSAIVVTSDDVSFLDLLKCSQALGGWPQGENTIVLSEQGGHIWVSLQADSAYQNIVSEDDRRQWTEALGRPQKYEVEIALSHDDNSHGLCLRFASEFATKWNAILSDIDDEVLSRAQLISKSYGCPWDRERS